MGSNIIPSFFDENKVGTIYHSRDVEVIREAEEYKVNNKIKPSKDDTYKIAFFMVDVQNSFCNPDNGTLFVPGAVEDNINICKFLFNNVDKITQCIASMDTHYPYQIFHPLWWINNETGKYPEPFTLISTDDIKSGKFSPLFQKEWSIKYCEKLEKEGKKVHTIWPFHCMLGSVSHALTSAVYEAILYHSTVRTTQPVFYEKGRLDNSEYYSALSPEVEEPEKEGGEFNKQFFNNLMSYDRVYIGGEASSHCVMETLLDIKNGVKGDKKLLNKIYILEDCTSPVAPAKDDEGNVIADFPKMAEEAMKDFENSGMNIVKSTEGIKL
jgi:nicotinamidase-related amidase